MYEKLEQSTHWIIQKSWGKDFTFGSDCTVCRSPVTCVYRDLGISQTVEGCVRSREQLQDHCLRNHAMPDEQFWFLPKRSAVWQLLEVVDTWHRVLDTGASVQACFLDLAKAFDRGSAFSKAE